MKKYQTIGMDVEPIQYKRNSVDYVGTFVLLTVALTIIFLFVFCSNGSYIAHF